MKSFLMSLFSMKSAVIFLLVFAAASGIATFIENDFGIAGSWSVVYNTTWFEIVQIVLLILFSFFQSLFVLQYHLLLK